jgi:hypothetical protein
MAGRSGISAQLGIATETTVGTYVAPTTFVPFTSESLRRTNEYIRTTALRAGRVFQAESLHSQTTHAADGSISFDVQDKGLGKFLNLLHGNTVTPSALTGGVLRQTHNIGATDPYGKAMTIQVGRPDVSGTVRPFSYLGSKVAAVTFNLETGGVLSSEWTIDAMDETTAQTLGTATYATGAKTFTFQNATIEFDDVVLTDCVKYASVSVTLPMNTDRYCIGAGTTKKEQILNDQIGAEITLEMEFSSLTQQTAFANSTRRKVELNCVGNTLSGTYSSGLNFTAAATVTTGEGPVVEGPDVLTQTVTLEVVDNGSATPLVIQYDSSDAAL